MNHKVENIELLYNDAKGLLDNVVLGTADDVMSTLEAGIDNLKTNWHGADATVNINDLIKVYNGLSEIRNALAELAVNSSLVAKTYQDIQINNGASVAPLSELSYTKKSGLETYSDSTPGVSIVPTANEGKGKVDSAKSSFESFVEEAKSAYDKIMNNWTVGGETRAAAESAFTTFNNEVNNYISVMTDVSTNITNALSNYDF